MHVNLPTEELIRKLAHRVRYLEGLGTGSAKARICHRRMTDFDKKSRLHIFKRVDDDEEVTVDVTRFREEVRDELAGLLGRKEAHNVITNVGAIQIHKGAYGTSGIQTNGFNYVALSNDTLTETATSTTLSTEIAANGLTRAQGTVTLPTTIGRITTVDKTFTASGAQSCQKAALFDASSTGNMNHALSFTQRALVNTDTIQITYSITIS